MRVNSGEDPIPATRSGAEAGRVLESLNQMVVDAAAAPWVLVVVLLFCAVDGFFPPVPSESVVVALAAVAGAVQGPGLWPLLAAAAAGAVIGDNVAYALGTSLSARRLRWVRTGRGQRALERAALELSRRPAVLLLTGRFVPVGRVAVNLSAGATGVPRRVFVPLSVLAGTTWAGLTVALGRAAGSWFPDRPLLAIGAAVILALALGVGVDAVLRRVGSGRPVGTSA